MTKNNDIVVENYDETDVNEQDHDAQNRDLIHSGRRRGKGKAKVIIALAVIALLGIIILTVVLSTAFSSATDNKEEDAATKAATAHQQEMYARSSSGVSLDSLKKNVLGSSIDEVKQAVDSEENQPSDTDSAPSETASSNNGVTLPVGDSESSYAGNDGNAPPTPAQRRLMGSVMMDDSRISQSQRAEPQQKASTATTNNGGDFLQGADFADGSVSLIKNRRYLLSAGTSFSCVLKTMIVTTYPGVTLCQLTKDVISDDGKTVLIRAGAQLQGEQTKAITQGIARVFVNWTTVKDRNVNVRINALGAGSLGASGLPAWIDTHFWQRFGGALMLSFIEDSLAAGTSRLSRENNSDFTMNNTTGTSSELAKTTLENSINIPPTGYINQGEMLTVIVPRNIDFSSVYEVR